MFAVAPGAYREFMGRWSEPLAGVFADFARVPSHGPVLDVGSGPGALTRELVARFGAGRVCAVDPEAGFAAEVARSWPGVGAVVARGEALPLRDDVVAGALAQLVVHFLDDAPAGVAELVRVTRPDGVVAACVWDHAGEHGPLAPFWQAAADLDPTVVGEADLVGTHGGDLARLLAGAGLDDVVERPLEVALDLSGPAAWWQPLELGVGPAGAYVARLDDAHRAALRERVVAALPRGPFRATAVAWAARGVVGPRVS